MGVLILRSRGITIDISVAGDCVQVDSHGCCTNPKGEFWCETTRLCHDPNKVCPSSGGGGGGGTKPPTNPGTSLCPAGGGSGIKESVCKSSYCGGGYSPSFYNDTNGDGIGCCRCDKPSTAPAPVTPTASGNSCDGPASASACKNLTVGETFYNICRCARTNDNNCACVGLGNVPAGGDCSANSNCEAGTTCVRGMCQAPQQPSRPTSPVAVGKVKGIECDDADTSAVEYCPSIGNWECEPYELGHLEHRCKSVGLSAEKLVQRRFAVSDLLTKPHAVVPTQFVGGAGIDIFEGGETKHVEVTGCVFYSGSKMLAVTDTGRRIELKGYVCYNGANCDTLGTEEARTECNEHKNDKAPYFKKLRGDVVSQADEAIGNYQVTDADHPNVTCNFSSLGCGPSSMTWLINKSGKQKISSPLALVDQYNFHCDTKTTNTADNVAVLNKYGIGTGKYEVINPGSDSNFDATQNAQLNAALDKGKCVVIGVQITTRSNQFGHFAVATKKESGDLVIFDPIYKQDGHINTGDSDGIIRLKEIQKYIGYVITTMVPTDVSCAEAKSIVNNPIIPM